MHSPVGQDTAFPLPAIVIFSQEVSPDIIREPLERGLHGLICMNNPQKSKRNRRKLKKKRRNEEKKKKDPGLSRKYFENHRSEGCLKAITAHCLALSCRLGDLEILLKNLSIDKDLYPLHLCPKMSLLTSALFLSNVFVIYV